MNYLYASLNLSAVESSLSTTRLASYQTLVGGATTDSAIGAYVWGLELNAALSPLLSMVEVVLRNSLHAAATHAFGRPVWFQDVLKHQGHRAWQNKLLLDPTISQNYYRKDLPPHDRRSIWVNGARKQLNAWRSPAEAKLADILQRLTHANKTHSPDQIIAHAMFGFWVDLMGPGFESTDPLALWPRCQTTAFAHDTSMTRARAANTLSQVKRLRNRISHHEPAWKIAHPLTPAGVHVTLTTQVQDMHALLHAMEPNAALLLQTAGTFQRIQWLLDPQTIAAFAGQTTPQQVNMRALSKKIRKFAKASQRAASTPQPHPTQSVHIVHAGKPLATLTPHY